MRRLKFILHRNQLYKVCFFLFSFIKPIFQYTDCIWTTLEGQNQRAYKQSNEAVRIVTCATKLMFTSALLTEARWETIKMKQLLANKFSFKWKLIYIHRTMPSTTP